MDEIVKRIKQGDEISFELLFRKYYIRLAGFAYKFIVDKDIAEEVAQDVFYRLWQNKKVLDEKKSVKSYLFASVKNQCINYLQHAEVKDKYKKFIRNIYLDKSTYNPSIHDEIIAKELESQYLLALENLPEQCRKIFELSRFEGLKYKEIALKLNISIKTVETQMSRALGKLRLELKEFLTILLATFISQL